jgi:tRNA (guanine-N(7)-)-methyltransferase subunit TRM82
VSSLGPAVADDSAAALHAFSLSDTPGQVETLPLPHPLLDFAPIPDSPGRLLVSLDTAWGVLKQNPGPGTDGRIKDVSLSSEQTEELQTVLAVVEVSSDGKVGRVV